MSENPESSSSNQGLISLSRKAGPEAICLVSTDQRHEPLTAYLKLNSWSEELFKLQLLYMNSHQFDTEMDEKKGSS